MTRKDAATALRTIAFRANEAANKRGLFKDVRPDQALMGVVSKIGDANKRVRRAGPLIETRLTQDGRRYGFGVDCAAAIVGLMSLCYQQGIAIDEEVLSELERCERAAKTVR